MKRILISLLLAWVAVAPGIASACAAGCEMDMHTDTASHIDGDMGSPASDRSPQMGDCHGPQAGQDVPEPVDVPDIGAMAAACMVAAAVLMPGVPVAPVHFESAGKHASAVLLLQSSIRSAPPDKPPQA